MALNDAEINPEEVGYVNAHGTNTKVNDRIETMAIKGGLGDHAQQVPVSSIKRHDGAPDRRRRQRRGDHMPHGDSGRSASANHQLWNTGSRV
jgi:hypothetical protein